MRAKILYLIAAAYGVGGFQLYHIPATREQVKASDPTLKAHVDLFSLHQIGWIFMIVSALAIAIVAYEDIRPKDQLAKRLRGMAAGYTLMTGLIMFWTLLYVVSWIETGDWHAIYGIANYGLTAGIMMICSRIVELPQGRGAALPAVHAAIVDDHEKQVKHEEIMNEIRHEKNGGAQ